MFSIVGAGKVGRALGSAFGVDALHREARPAGLVLLAVPDSAIVEMAAHFPGRCVHMSGSLALEDVPCAHPLTSFDGRPADWTGTPLAVTGAVPETLLSEFRRVGFAPFDLPIALKPLYHAAAVMTSGHVATLWLEAQRLLEEAGVPLPEQGIWPLAEATLRNVRAQGLSGRTGPFARGDQETIRRDKDALPEDWAALWEALGRMIT